MFVSKLCLHLQIDFKPQQAKEKNKKKKEQNKYKIKSSHLNKEKTS